MLFAGLTNKGVARDEIVEPGEKNAVLVLASTPDGKSGAGVPVAPSLSAMVLWTRASSHDERQLGFEHSPGNIAGADHADGCSAFGRRQRCHDPRASTEPRKPLKLSESIVSGIVRVADALCIALVGILFYIYFLGWKDISYQAYLTEIAANIGLTLSVFHYVGLYDFNTIVAWPNRMRQMVVLSALVMLVLAALAVALKISDQFSRAWFFSSFVFSAMAIFVSRGIHKSAIRQLARVGRPRSQHGDRRCQRPGPPSRSQAAAAGRTVEADHRHFRRPADADQPRDRRFSGSRQPRRPGRVCPPRADPGRGHHAAVERRRPPHRHRRQAACRCRCTSISARI